MRITAFLAVSNITDSEATVQIRGLDSSWDDGIRNCVWCFSKTNENPTEEDNDYFFLTTLENGISNGPINQISGCREETTYYVGCYIYFNTTLLASLFSSFTTKSSEISTPEVSLESMSVYRVEGTKVFAIDFTGKNIAGCNYTITISQNEGDESELRTGTVSTSDYSDTAKCYSLTFSLKDYPYGSYMIGLYLDDGQISCGGYRRADYYEYEDDDTYAPLEASCVRINCGLIISWSPSENATWHRIKLTSKYDERVIDVTDSAVSEVTVNNLMCGESYEIAIQGRQGEYHSGYVTCGTCTVAPSQPKLLNIQVSGLKITGQWKPKNGGVFSYVEIMLLRGRTILKTLQVSDMENNSFLFDETIDPGEYRLAAITYLQIGDVLLRSLKDDGSNYAFYSDTFTVQNGRPSFFKWSYKGADENGNALIADDDGYKKAGNYAYITQNEWEDLKNNINLVRAYSNSPQWVWTSNPLQNDNSLCANMYNEARKAIRSIGLADTSDEAVDDNSNIFWGALIPKVTANETEITTYVNDDEKGNLNIIIDELNAIE